MLQAKPFQMGNIFLGQIFHPVALWSAKFRFRTQNVELIRRSDVQILFPKCENKIDGMLQKIRQQKGAFREIGGFPQKGNRKGSVERMGGSPVPRYRDNISRLQFFPHENGGFHPDGIRIEAIVHQAGIQVSKQGVKALRSRKIDDGKHPEFPRDPIFSAFRQSAHRFHISQMRTHDKGALPGIQPFEKFTDVVFPKFHLRKGKFSRPAPNFFDHRKSKGKNVPINIQPRNPTIPQFSDVFQIQARTFPDRSRSQKKEEDYHSGGAFHNPLRQMDGRPQHKAELPRGTCRFPDLRPMLSHVFGFPKEASATGEACRRQGACAISIFPHCRGTRENSTRRFADKKRSRGKNPFRRLPKKA